MCNFTVLVGRKDVQVGMCLLLDFDCISGKGIKIVQSWGFLGLSAVEWKLGALSIGCILH